MFKFVVLAVIMAVAAAKPGLLSAQPSLIELREPRIARLGNFVETIPSAISHQQSTIIHSRANLVTPIITPVFRRPWTTEFKTFAAPAPILRSGPILKSFIAPSPILKTYGAAPVLAYRSAPLLRSW